MQNLKTYQPFLLVSNPDLKIALLKIEQSQDYSLLINNPHSIQDILNKEHKSHIRKQQLLAARYLLQALLPNDKTHTIAYTPHGKPYIPNSSQHISISHTKDYISLILSEEKKVGIDIEILDPRILRIENKFLRPDEKQFINQSHYLEQLYIIWSAKEVLFKIHEVGGLIFKDNLIVHPFNYTKEGTLQADIITPEYQKTFTLHYQTIDNLIIVHAKEE